MQQTHPYKVVGIYPQPRAAREARESVLSRGFASGEVFVITRGDVLEDEKIEPEGNAIRDEMVRNILGGAAAGAVAGSAGAAGLAATGFALVVTQPVAATLLAAGYGGAVGSLLGAGKAFGVAEPDLAAMIKDALKEDHAVLVVQARDQQARERAMADVEATAAEDILSV